VTLKNRTLSPAAEKFVANLKQVDEEQMARETKTINQFLR
jgi:hypothetical protein